VRDDETAGGPATGRVLWVTGAGSGMGRASALSAASQGWRVALSGRREAALAETARAVEAAGGSALVLPVDVGDAGQVAQARDAIHDRWGAVAGLVLAAGLNTPKRMWADQDFADFEAIVATNLVAVARVVDATLPDLRTQQGVVVVVSSYSGWQFTPLAGVAYSATKTALSSLCRTLNASEAPSGVRACHLCPGDVDTEFLAMRPQAPDAQARAVMLTADDVARAVQFVLDSPAHVRIDELVISPTSQH
jgi:NADP-dependent 3-hydroxy acid dehydrogenase YdfG